MDLLLDVERRSMDHEVAPVLLVLAAPDELGVQVAVAPLVGDSDGILCLLLENGLVLRGWDVPPPRLLVTKRLHRLPARALSCLGALGRCGRPRPARRCLRDPGSLSHHRLPAATDAVTARSIISRPKGAPPSHRRWTRSGTSQSTRRTP